jgi:hypothetical protein
MSETKLKSYLAENPRMMGVLFTVALLLTATDSAAAANMGCIAGP